MEKNTTKLLRLYRARKGAFGHDMEDLLKNLMKRHLISKECCAGRTAFVFERRSCKVVLEMFGYRSRR
ncbi:hypothetical protein AMEX_G23820 [Astyanax mexicanus]|uniref:Uncharacterized protein n=1 Tax=Astyanax mexicanus TaxID=7994 RepID=A0A8T2KW54_ASTMX|nr:hypothetical protein AMEX_G23820 [Astyanax mexicanus]